jgi:hypothetical protein
MRRRLAILADVAEDVRRSVRRARARGRARAGVPHVTPEQASATEVKRRLDETRARLRSEIPPRQD